MVNGKIVVEEVTYGLSGESIVFYGYFDSIEQAIEWVRKNHPDYETVEESKEYQAFTWYGGITWLIHDTEDDEFQERCLRMKALDRAYFDEAYMLPTE